MASIEYFNKHVEGPTSHPSVTGELSPNVWHFAQLGLVEVSYQLRRINHHIKVFAAVRKEAYARLAKTTVMAQQYRGSAVDIAYSRQSLREIFLNNVRLLKSDTMVKPERLRADPLEAFLGADHSHRRIHARRRGKFRVYLPAHAATPARLDDHWTAPGCAPAI